MKRPEIRTDLKVEFDKTVSRLDSKAEEIKSLVAKMDDKQDTNWGDLGTANAANVLLTEVLIGLRAVVGVN